MLYSEALDFLYSLGNYEKTPPVNYDATTHDIGRMGQLLAALGNPHERYKTIHVAGSKGKGSTSAMLASVLRHMGLKVGLYTSPHLSSFRERTRVNGQLIPPEVVGLLADQIKSAITKKVTQEDGDGVAIEKEETTLPITTFDAGTALSFLHFARENVDWAVIEVGLGGKLDSTNVITPQVSVITSISFDHMHMLGNTLAEIAAHKAGIIKPAVPVVSQNQALEAAQVIERVAHERTAPITFLGRHWRWTPGASALNKQTFEVKQVSLIRSKNKPFVNDLEGWYEIQLNGKHQIDNAVTVIATIDMIRESLRASGVPDISARVVRDGLRNAQWPGRFEVLRGDPPLILDGAHNVDSVNKLLMTLVEHYPGKRWTFVFGCYKDKDADQMLKQLSARAHRFIMTQAEDNPRVMPVEQLLDIANAAT
ncbi:MAG: bifunctional folylpolyglutamate synthase/dihydrofolate synthase [Anaerolineae bacterium]|nr:bifunctional folylpolyglutamate synthase/dihydrofolate synthase [Anaerolineae bacterium]